MPVAKWSLTISERTRIARMLMHCADVLRAGPVNDALCWETLARLIAGEKVHGATLMRARKRLAAAEEVYHGFGSSRVEVDAVETPSSGKSGGRGEPPTPW